MPELPKKDGNELFYSVNPSNWFKYFPYKFEICKIVPTSQSKEGLFRSQQSSSGKGGGGVNTGIESLSSDFSIKQEFYLPIPPQQYSIQQIPATEATPTMGGIVEEVSFPYLFTITLSGTTGMSISGGQMGSSAANAELFKADGPTEVSDVATSQRKTFDELMGISTIAGRAANAAMNSLERVLNVITPESTVPFARGGTAVNTSDPKRSEKVWTHDNVRKDGTWLEKLGNAIAGPFAAKSTPPTLWTNGFSLDHALRQFFLIYQKQKAMDTFEDPRTALFFVDTKSNTRYRVTPRSLNFSKTADTPFTTTYSMVFRAWDLKDASASSLFNPSAVDRLGPGGDLSEAYTVNAVSLYRQMRKVEMLASNRGRAAGQLVGSAIDDAKGSYFG